MNGSSRAFGLDLDEQLCGFLQGPSGFDLDEHFSKDLMKNEENFLNVSGFLGIWEVACLKALEFQSFKDLGQENFNGSVQCGSA
ncbi:hypothetical protein ACFX1S_020393 [Malus domestica]